MKDKPRMTYVEFLELLQEAGRMWKITDNLEIVIEGAETVCPYLAVPFSGRLPMKDAKRIWAAADYDPKHDPEVRKDLLRACGLLKG